MEMAEDFQDFAATTMNELLGWYGYEKLDSRGTCLKEATPTSSSSSPRGEEPRRGEDTPRSGSPAEGASEIISSREEEPCRSRVCDWCRLSHHTVSQVNLLDGEERLQFCSSRCLNQYKMHIFCRETQAYLQSNPASGHSGEEDSRLITPDLWLRCDSSGVRPTDRPERRSAHKKLAKKRARTRPPEPPPPAHFAPSFQPPPLRLNPPAAHSSNPLVPPLFAPPLGYAPFGHAHQQQLGRLNRTDPCAGRFHSAQNANTVMLPYPLFVPLPVPIPIPIPLHKFLPRGMGDDSETTCEPSSTKTLDSSEDEEITPAKRRHQ